MHGLEPARYDVAIVEPDERLRIRLGIQLAGATQYATIEDLAQRLRGGRPVVAVFGPGFVSSYGFQQVHRLTGLRPELGAVFAVEELTTDVLQQALRSGARDAVVIDAEASLHQAVDRVGEMIAGSFQRTTAPPDTAADPGRLVAVFSTKGGVGKTVIATNIAVSMAKRSPAPVALVDADLQFGDVAVMLGLAPEHTILDAAAAVQYGDHEMVSSLVGVHGPSGLRVLPAPLEPTPPDTILPGEMVNICAALQQGSGHVVVDLPASFSDQVLAVIEAADEVLLVGSMDIPSIKNLKVGMQALDLAALAGPKLRLVLNHVHARVKLDIREIERVLGLNANFPVPDDIAVPVSVNAGQPVVLTEPKAPVSRAIENIADALLVPGGARVPVGAKRRK